MTETERKGKSILVAGMVAVLLYAVPAHPEFGAAFRKSAFPEIGTISFQVASPWMISYEELSGLVAVRPGTPLTPDGVRESIRLLNRKGLFRELSVHVREEGGKAHLLFYLHPLPAVSEIRMTGRERIPSSQIIAASRIRRGMTVDEADLAEAEKSVLSLLQGKGFLAAGVTVSAACSVDTGTGTVRIDVEEGSPAVVEDIRIEGAGHFLRDRMIGLLGVSADSPFDYRAWEKGVKRLRGEYKREGFLTVHVVEGGGKCEDREGMCLWVRVEEGPRYGIIWEGADRYSVGALEKASGIYSEDAEASEAMLAYDLKERLLSFYRANRHFRAAVDVETEADAEDGRRLEIFIREGKPGFLKRIRFEGNESIPEKRLRKQMLSTERGSLRLITGSGEFDEETWNADLAALVGLYQKEGFARARIASVDTDWDERGGITATIRIEEGTRYRLDEILLRGNDHFLREEILRQIGNRIGRNVDYAGLDQDQEAIAVHYRNEGYLDGSVDTGFETDEEKGTAVIRFDIREGPRYRLGNVVVQGNLLTDPEVVYREIPIPRGAAAGEKDLLKFQQEVFATGLFRSVRMNRVKRPAEGILDLIVEVQEALFFEVEFGAGFGTDTGARGFVGAKSRNLDGRGRRLSARVTASRKEQVYLADLREPWVFGNRWKWEGGVTASHQEAERESFNLRKTSIVTSITKTILERSSVSLQHELSRDDVFNVMPGAILSPEDQGSANISAVRGLFVLDFRDDPFNPKRGSVNSGSAEFASAFLGSEVDYVKVSGQSSWYFPVLRRNTFAVSGRAGVVHPLGETPEVPIQKRFFLGGRTTVRGFSEESLGPMGPDGTPTGGNYMFNGNAEFRVPLQYGFILAVFLDAGSVWFQGDPDNRFDLRESTGLGLRYVTPIGPISFDYGWKLDRRAGESPSEWHFTIGAVF